MAYAKKVELDRGPFVGAWELAIREGGLVLEFTEKRAADSFRYRLHEVRKAAEVGRPELAALANRFAVSLQKGEGSWKVVVKNRAAGMLSKVDLRTEQERKEDAHAEAWARRLRA